MHKLIFFFLLCFTCTFLHGQIYQISESNSMNIKGTSTLHDWNASVPDVSGFPDAIDISGSIPSFTFTAKVATIDGGRGASMNSKIKKALKNTEYPEISFTQAGEATVSKEGNTYIITSEGTLSIAGVEKEVSLNLSGKVENDVLLISGSQPVKMSEYNIEPPSAMFGQIQTDENVEVIFNITYVKK